MSTSQIVITLSIADCYADREKVYWRLWREQENYLSQCCLKWMGNSIDAEDALSRAMLKAWEKIRNCQVEIKSLKAWLTRLTYNLCMDIHREYRCGASQVETLESDEELVSQEQTPLIAATQQELENFFCLAIDELSAKLKETFILHFEEELSYQEIAIKLNISYDNVRKRISQARAILREKYNLGFVGENKNYHVETFNKTSLNSTIVSSIPEEFAAIDLDTNLFVVEEEPQAAILSTPEIEAMVVDAQSDENHIEESQNIGQSISQKLNFNLHWRLEIAAIQTKFVYTGCFNEAHLQSFIEYFLLRRRIRIDSRDWVKIANNNYIIDST